jgi:hypothetical protein
MWRRTAGTGQIVQRTVEVRVGWVTRSGRTSCVLLIELNWTVFCQWIILRKHVTQSAGCQQTSSRDIQNFVVSSNEESSAAYCPSRRRCSDISSDSQPCTVPRWAQLVITEQTASCHGNQNSITSFTTAHDLSLSYARLIKPVDIFPAYFSG